ncbi:hypothetical protein JCM8097_002616 [Rhodosporidiobolus ruineniae]
MPRVASASSPSRPPQPPSTPRLRQQQPTRMRNQQQSVPGIITLPTPKSPAHSVPVQPSPNSARHSSSSTGPSPLPQASNNHHQSRDAESTRRRRGKQNRGDSPLKHSPADAEDNSTETAASGPAAAADTPTKQRRRRGGRSNRQASPPLPDAADSAALGAPFPSTTPPQSDYDALSSLHSRSVPPDPVNKHHLHPRSRYNDTQSSGDEWEVPAVPVQPKENLSWQQEMLRNGSAAALNSRQKGTESPSSRPRSRVNTNVGGGGTGKDARTTGSGGSASSGGGRSRPPLHTSISDNGAATGPSLNWQQELLLQTPDLTALHQPSPVKPVSSALTPARQRRNQQRDNETFGLGELDLNDEDEFADIFASPGRGGGNQYGGSRNSSNSSSSTTTGFSTPTKALSPPSGPVEPRYAGPTFHNSPAPSSLPVPSFMLRRKVEGVVA